jgi:DNA modification methylase
LSRNGEANKLAPEDRPAHDWYRFVLSFPPHLVRHYLARFRVGAGQRVLDPFCGTGTTLVECRKLGIPSVGVEAHPMAHFATLVKLDWTPKPEGLLQLATTVAQLAAARLRTDGIAEELAEDASLPSPPATLPAGARKETSGLRMLEPEKQKLLLADSISPLPLHKALVLLDCLEERGDECFTGHERLALARALVVAVSNLHFGPEVGVASPKADAPVLAPWLNEVRRIARDLRTLWYTSQTQALVHRADSRQVSAVVEPGSVDAVITSPPYPNEKDYTRTTRLESVLLGLVNNQAELRRLKKGLVRSNTRGVYAEDTDDRWVEQHPRIQEIAAAIEERRLRLGKTSGFERLYPRVTRLYFGGMARHFADLRKVLRPGASLAYVVGDQASYLRVLIRTGRLLAEIAQSQGYELIGIDLFRTRLATATREQLREEVVVLRWPG